MLGVLVRNQTRWEKRKSLSSSAPTGQISTTLPDSSLLSGLPGNTSICSVCPRPEIINSLVSIAIFAGYGVLTVYAERNGVIRIDWMPGASTVLINLALLTVWNEVHFYTCHRLLHTRWLYRKVHVVHHRSVVPTPFTTYSFHWVEATMLSSVMILMALVWPLDIVSMIVFPGISLIANSIGHMNYAVFPDKDHGELLAACQRHTAHHTRWNGNYGFYWPLLDRWLGTRLERR